MTLWAIAYPILRFKVHNTFENIHRWGAWFSLAILWAEIVFFARTHLHPTSPSLGLIVIRLPACIPSRNGGRSGGSILISNAGDWTGSTIANPRPYYWVKGIPVTGVLCMARLFRSVVIVTTGSGIGPCLGVMQDIPDTKVRVIWSTPDSERTFGRGILDAVKEMDPQAVIWDTRTKGRPDLVKMAW